MCNCDFSFDNSIFCFAFYICRTQQSTERDKSPSSTPSPASRVEVEKMFVQADSMGREQEERVSGFEFQRVQWFVVNKNSEGILSNWFHFSSFSASHFPFLLNIIEFRFGEGDGEGGRAVWGENPSRFVRVERGFYCLRTAPILRLLNGWSRSF